MNDKREGPLLRFLRPVVLARLFFILIVMLIAALIAWHRYALSMLQFQLMVLGAAIVFVIFEYAVSMLASRNLLIGIFGCLVGLIFSQFFYTTIPEEVVRPEVARMVCNLAFGYFGTVIALRHMDWLRPGNLRFFFMNPSQRPKILDSSVLIDGRVVDMVKLGLIDGPVIVPNFVIQEIQSIADASEAHRRTRGRRGLDVLDRLRQSCKSLDILEEDFTVQGGVDQKLIQACRAVGGDLVTNDYNLKKIAELHQLKVISVNEVADALRPTVYVGEVMEMAIVKVGKEPGQGVGYLGDGTMVVVEEGADLVGSPCEVVVNNILQNPTGRLVFARLHEAPAEELETAGGR
jgi:uncharacterized protein YacL